MNKVLQDLHPLALSGGPINEWPESIPNTCDERFITTTNKGGVLKQNPLLRV